MNNYHFVIKTQLLDLSTHRNQIYRLDSKMRNEFHSRLKVSRIHKTNRICNVLTINTCTSCP